MLTPIQTVKTSEELRENYKRLNEPEDEILKDVEISRDEFHRVLDMRNPYPGNVWKVRDYLEDRLKEKGIPMKPWSRLSDHSLNLWYPYDTPWRDKKAR